LHLISPLNKVLGLGTSKGGTEHWWAQRLTAIALLPLGLWFVVSLLLLNDFSYLAVVAWVREPVSSLLLILSVLCLVYHSHLGVQVVLEDYVHTNGTRIAALVLSLFAHVFLVVAAVFSILKVAFGAL